MKETYILTVVGDDWMEGYVSLTPEEFTGVVKALASLSSSGPYAPMISFRRAENNEEYSKVALDIQRKRLQQYNESQQPTETAMSIAFKKAAALVS